MVEHNHTVGHVLLQALAGKGTLTFFARDDGRNASLFEPLEQAAQFGP